MKNIILLLGFVFSGVFLSAQSSKQGVRDSILRRDSLLKVRTVEMVKLIPVFKSKKANEDSAFSFLYSDIYSVTPYVSSAQLRSEWKTQIYSSGYYPENAEKDFVNANIGDVIGPYVNGNTIGIYKVKWKGMSVDSARVRHILIAYKGAERADPQIKRPRWKAKQLADSLCNVIVSGKTEMKDLVLAFTDDPGSKVYSSIQPSNYGDYGWFTRESPFVKEFKDAGFNNKVGATVVVETQFGYHIIQVLARVEKKICVGAIPVLRLVDPEVNYHVNPAQGITLPVFPGGITALKKYLHDSLRYPANASAKHEEAYSEIMFTVGKDGKVSNAVILTNDAHESREFSEEAKRLILVMPAWQPATYKGKPIDWGLKVIVPFRLDE